MSLINTMKMMISVILTTIMMMTKMMMKRMKTIIMTIAKSNKVFRNLFYPMEQFPTMSNCARRNYAQSIVP
jgi:hypothetical protein